MNIEITPKTFVCLILLLFIFAVSLAGLLGDYHGYHRCKTEYDKMLNQAIQAIPEKPSKKGGAY